MKQNTTTLKDTFVKALESYKKRNFKIAQTLCYKILSIDPDHFDSLLLLANISALNSNYSEAKELLSKANEIKPNNLGVLNNLGTACKELGDLKEAVNFMKK